MNLFKAFGLKKADEKHGDEWWNKMLKIAYNMDVPYKEREKQLEAAGFDVENDFDALMGMEPPPPKTTSLEEDLERFKREAPHMGYSQEKIDEIVRDTSPGSDNPMHQRLRNEVTLDDWLKFGQGARNITSNELPNEAGIGAEGRYPGTTAAAKEYFDAFQGVATGQGGGYNLHPLRPEEGLTEGGQALPKYAGPTEEDMKKPSFQNAAALNKEDKMNIYKVFGLKKAKKKERIPNPEGKNMAALINSPTKTDRERAHQILGNKRKKIMGIGGKSNKKQMLQHLDREFKDGGDFQEYVRVRPEPTKSKSDTPAKTPAPTTTKTTSDKTPRSRSSIPKLNPPKTTPKKPKEEDSPW